MAWLTTEKGLNVVQVLIYWCILTVYLLSIKVEVFQSYRQTVLVIGAVLTVSIFCYRFFVIDKKPKKQKGE